MGDITIQEPTLKDQKLTSKVDAGDINKYFKTRELFLEYDTELFVDDSILNVPLISIILPLAWITGSDIYVKKIDKKFKNSMDKLKNYFKTIYPRAPFTTEIIAEEIIENKININNPDRKTGLLFSGGADSVYSLITNMNLKPRLIMNWGIDDFPYPERNEHWEKTISIYKKFARQKGLDFNLIKTNASQVLDIGRISHRFHRELYDGAIRAALQHSLILLPIAAPLSEGRFNHLIIASTFIPSYDFSKHPRAAIPEADEKILWADLTVKHDGFALSRNDKIFGEIANYMKKDPFTLRVCLRSPFIDGKINDSTCEKCLRTIASLTLAGIDPNSCGFHVDNSTFKEMRNYWENAKFSHPGYHWTQIQSAIPQILEDDFYGSREFFEWFRKFNFETVDKNWFYRDLYTALPYQFAKYLEKFYNKIGIQVHQEPFIREK